MPYAFLPAKVVREMVPLASELGVIDGPQKFVTMYLNAGGPENLPQEWHEQREKFLLESLSQAEANKESYWASNKPTRRHLIMILWAYSPDPERILRRVRPEVKEVGKK